LKEEEAPGNIEEHVMTASRIMINILAESLVHEGVDQITLPQFRILDMIRNYSKKPSEIAKMLNVSPPAITMFLEKLEEKGLIKRNFSKEDRRRVVLELTKKGDRLVQKVNHFREGYLRRILEELDAATLKQMEEALIAFEDSYLMLKKRGLSG
jgi:DNA-binding MarR family transcriptional regulator